MIKQDTKTNTEIHTNQPLPADHLEAVAGWGGASSGMAYVYRPSTVDQLREIFKQARQNGRSIGLRGGGNSYGDAAMNDESIVLDLTRMNRILAWDPENGRLKVEPGVTLQRVWEYTIEDGWWVPVATGTAKITIGGKENTVSAGQMLIMPANVSHALHAAERFKMLLVMIRGE